MVLARGSDERAKNTAEQVAAALSDMLEPLNARGKCELCAGDCKGHCDFGQRGGRSRYFMRPPFRPPAYLGRVSRRRVGA